LNIPISAFVTWLVILVASLSTAESTVNALVDLDERVEEYVSRVISDLSFAIWAVDLLLLTRRARPEDDVLAVMVLFLAMSPDSVPPLFSPCSDDDSPEDDDSLLVLLDPDNRLIGIEGRRTPDEGGKGLGRIDGAGEPAWLRLAWASRKAATEMRWEESDAMLSPLGLGLAGGSKEEGDAGSDGAIDALDTGRATGLPGFKVRLRRDDDAEAGGGLASGRTCRKDLRLKDEGVSDEVGVRSISGTCNWELFGKGGGKDTGTGMGGGREGLDRVRSRMAQVKKPLVLLSVSLSLALSLDDTRGGGTGEWDGFGSECVEAAFTLSLLLEKTKDFLGGGGMSSSEMALVVDALDVGGLSATDKLNDDGLLSPTALGEAGCCGLRFRLKGILRTLVEDTGVSGWAYTLWPLAREGGEDGAKTYSDEVDVDAVFSSSSGRPAWEAAEDCLRFEKRPIEGYERRKDIEWTTNGLR
jgi:hypothetical protein